MHWELFTLTFQVFFFLWSLCLIQSLGSRHTYTFSAIWDFPGYAMSYWPHEDILDAVWCLRWHQCFRKQMQTLQLVTVRGKTVICSNHRSNLVWKINVSTKHSQQDWTTTQWRKNISIIYSTENPDSAIPTPNKETGR